MRKTNDFIEIYSIEKYVYCVVQMFNFFPESMKENNFFCVFEVNINNFYSLY